MEIKKIKFKNQKFIVVLNNEEEKTAGENLVGMIMFYCKENGIQPYDSFEIDHDVFLKKYHKLTYEKLKKGEAWIVKVKIPIDNPEINFLTKNLPGIFFDKELAQQWARGHQKSSNIQGAIFEIENVSLGYKFDTK